MLSGMPIRITRRAALALLAGGAVAACTPGSDSGPDASPSPDADALTREQVAADEWSLVALYDAALSSQPDLAAELSTIRDQHVEHAAALGSSTPPSGSASASPAPPGRDALAAAEATAAKQRAQACGSAHDTELARLLALIAASEAGHAAYLKRSPA